MMQYAEECRALGIRYIFDPGQQCARMDGGELADGVKGAAIVICNDYEFELLRQKTGLGESEILEKAKRGPDRHARRTRLLGVHRPRPGGSAGRRTAADRRSHRRRRRVSRRSDEGLALGLPYMACALASAAWRRPMHSSTWAARAMPTRGTSSNSGSRAILARCRSEQKPRNSKTDGGEVPAKRACAALVVAIGAASMPLAAQNSPQAWDATFRALTSAANIGEYMRRLSARPHHVGSPSGKDNAEWMAARFKEWGWDARIETYEVLFPTPKERVVEMVAPTIFAAVLAPPPPPPPPPPGKPGEPPRLQRAFYRRRRHRAAGLRQLRRAARTTKSWSAAAST